MKTLIVSIVIFMAGLLFQHAQAQISIESGSTTEWEIKKLNAKKEAVRTEEKGALKQEVKAINERLEQGEIDWQEAEKLKKEAAEKRALNIEDKLNIIESNIALLERNKEKDFRISVGYGIFGDKKEKEVVDSIPSRTTSSPFFAFGLNNAIPEGGSLDDSPYKIGGSRFFEMGYEFSTALSKNGFFRLKYGLSLQFNGLKPEGNQYVVQDGDQTYLEEYPIHLEKSKFRNDHLVVPVHFEFGPSNIVQGSEKSYYSTEEEFKFGIGGYAGLNLNTVQKLKYKEEDHREKTKLKKGYNTSNFIYGLSAYIGYDWYSLYLKYDLNPIFTDNLVAQNNVSLGVRVAF